MPWYPAGVNARFGLLIGLLAWWLSAWPARAEAEQYTLATLVARVSRESPSVIAARATASMRRAQKLEQELRYLPEGDAFFVLSTAPRVRCIDPTPGSDTTNPGFRLNNCLDTNVVDLVTSAPGTSAADRGPFGNVVLNFMATLRQPLFTSLKIESANAAARAGVAYEDMNARAAELDVALAAVRIYTQLKTARATLEAIRRGTDMLDRWLRRVNDELDGKNPSGYSESDALRLRAQIANVQIWRADHQRNAAVALEALRAICDDAHAEIDDEELRYEQHSSEEQQTWLDRMERYRPELVGGRAGIRYYAAVRKVQLGFALPDLAIITGFNWGYAPSVDLPTIAFANLPASAPGAIIGAAVRQPLTLGPVLSRWDQARHDERMQQHRLALGHTFWTFEVDKAWIDLQEAQRRLDEVEHGVRIVEGWYVTVDSELNLGLRNDGRELIEVVMAWMSFMTRDLQARADAVVALAQLRRVSGQPIVDAGAVR